MRSQTNLNSYDLKSCSDWLKTLRWSRLKSMHFNSHPVISNRHCFLLFFSFSLNLEIAGFNCILKRCLVRLKTCFTFIICSRLKCNDGNGTTPLYVNVNMNTGKTANTWVDALSASFAGVQVIRQLLAVCT